MVCSIIVKYLCLHKFFHFLYLTVHLSGNSTDRGTDPVPGLVGGTKISQTMKKKQTNQPTSTDKKNTPFRFFFPPLFGRMQFTANANLMFYYI